MRFKCPKCKTVVETDKKIEFCVCGGKYETEIPQFFEDIFRGKYNNKDVNNQ
jgi:hypothetical protein